MEEIYDIHSLNLEWGCLTNLVNKISDIEDKIEGGWPELIDIVADAMTEEGEKKTDPADLFFNLYQFLFRLYYRLKANNEKREFNTVSKITICGKEVFRITNYNYQSFKFARKVGAISGISNDFIDIEITKLTDAQRRALERKTK